MTLDVTYKAKYHLDKKGVDYLVPSHKILNNRLSPNKEFLLIVNHCNSMISVRLKLQNRNACSVHYHGHYCANIDHYFCSNLSLIHVIVKKPQKYALDKYINQELNLLMLYHIDMILMLLGWVKRLVGICKGITQCIFLHGSEGRQLIRWRLG